MKTYTIETLDGDIATLTAPETPLVQRGQGRDDQPQLPRSQFWLVTMLLGLLIILLFGGGLEIWLEHLAKVRS